MGVSASLVGVIVEVEGIIEGDWVGTTGLYDGDTEGSMVVGVNDGELVDEVFIGVLERGFWDGRRDFGEADVGLRDGLIDGLLVGALEGLEVGFKEDFWEIFDSATETDGTAVKSTVFVGSSVDKNEGLIVGDVEGKQDGVNDVGIVVGCTEGWLVNGQLDGEIDGEILVG